MVELIDLVERACGRPLRFVLAASQSGDAARTMADTARLRALDWVPRTTLLQGLRDQVNHVQQILDDVRVMQ